jgi:hypothetical protein
MSRLAKEEQFIMSWAGRIMEWVGIAGAVVTFFVCFFFDRLAGRLIMDFGWAQLLGLFGGTIFFTALALFGVAVDRFLGTVKELLK